MLIKRIDQPTLGSRHDSLSLSITVWAALMESGLLFYLATLTRPGNGETVFTVYAVLSGMACLLIACLVPRS
jgi:hypothetical protein